MGTTGQSITLANSIIGVGILAMPFCFQQCGVLLATVILLSMGLVSRLCCYFLLKSAILTRRRNYEFLAFHVFGPAGKMAVEMGIIGFLMGTCIAYFVVVGDLGPQIIAKMFNINQSDILRTSIMVIVSLVCVLPLGLLRNVDSFSNVSAATIAFYFCLVIKVIIEATSQLLTTDWTSRIEMWKPSGVLQCVPIFSMALFCQTQLFEIFESLPTLSLEKMCLVTKNAINICSAVYFTLGVFGYIAFGSQEISGNILMSLSPTMASDVIKLGFVMSLAFSFPLIIFPCRASLYSFLYRNAHISHGHPAASHENAIPIRTFRALTLGIVGASLAASLLLPGVERVLGLLGATVGALVCLVFPAAAFLHLTRKHTSERLLAKFIVVLGLIILVLGSYANLEAADAGDKYDDKHITQERIDQIVEDFFHNMDKTDGVMAKPVLNHPSPIQDVNKLNNDIVRDSEVQPPNPVPPESHSNEKVPVIIPVNEVKKSPDILLDPRDTLDKVSETHPKNIQSRLNEKKANGNIVDNTKNVEAVNKEEKIKEDKEKLQSSQEKADMMKQQQLIETIKQHGKEQKELIKEQKEILDELIKTKKELEKNKKELDSNEAKKIAVESIQKIANVAIQSLSGVTDKSVDQKEVKDEPLEKIVNAAVNEIAKKAEETLDAIKQIDKPKDVPVPQNENMKRDENDFNRKTNNSQGQQYKPIESKIEDKPLKIVNQAPAVDNKELEKMKNVNQNSMNKEVPNVQNNVQISDIKQNEILSQNKNSPNKETLEGADNQFNQKNVNAQVNEHSHLPDEPQSYKQGEDSQNQNKELNKNLGNNVPLPIAMNGNNKNVAEAMNKINNAENQDSKDKTQDVQPNGANNNNYKVDNILSNIAKGNIIRHKREVVDCTEKTSLKPEDKQICESLLNNPNLKERTQVILPKANLEVIVKEKSQDEILPKIDMGEMALQKNLPQPAMAIHHMRSLKSFDEDKKR